MKTSSCASQTIHLLTFNLGVSSGADYTPSNGYTLSGNKSQKITVSGTMNVAFGVNGQYRFLYNQTSNVACNRNTFAGDPAPGDVKKYFVKFKGDVATGNYFLKNKVTGNFLDSYGNTARVKARAGGKDQQWKLAISADFHYNINNTFQDRGV